MESSTMAFQVRQELIDVWEYGDRSERAMVFATSEETGTTRTRNAPTCHVREENACKRDMMCMECRKDVDAPFEGLSAR